MNICGRARYNLNILALDGGDIARIAIVVDDLNLEPIRLQHLDNGADIAALQGRTCGRSDDLDDVQEFGFILRHANYPVLFPVP
jgi:hypothetical protein